MSCIKKKIAGLLSVGVLLASCSHAERTFVVARVGMDTITNQDLVLAWNIHRDVDASSPDGSVEQMTSLKRDLLDKLIDHHILLAQARRQGMTIDVESLRQSLELIRSGYDNAEFQRQLEKRHLSVEAWERMQQERFLVKTWIEREVVAKIDIKEGEIKDYYQRHQSQFRAEEQVRARHIVVEDETQAEQLYRRLKKGEDFGTLATKFSVGPEAAQGGDLGYFTRSDYPPVFTDTCFKLQEGDLSAIVASEYGFHIFEVLDRRPARRLPYREASAEIRKKLLNERVGPALDARLRDLRETLTIAIDEQALQKVSL